MEIIANILKMTSKEILDIVALVQNNPLTKLSNDYGSKIIQKIQQRFDSNVQQLFVANFYCYLNYNSKTDFVINLDRVWKWLGYGRVQECKRVLVKNFIEDTDYKVEIYFEQDGAEKIKPDEKQEKIEKSYPILRKMVNMLLEKINTIVIVQNASMNQGENQINLLILIKCQEGEVNLVKRLKDDLVKN